MTRLFLSLFVVCTLALPTLLAPASVSAQEKAVPEVQGKGDAAAKDLPQSLKEAERKAAEALRTTPPEPAAGPEVALPIVKEVNVLEMFLKGGPLMWPILIMSLIAVLFATERFIALRVRRILPPGFKTGLEQLGLRQNGIDPRKAYQLCQQYPSVAANVLKSVLLKVGRPHAEVEAAFSQACEREANRLYRNVRPINLTVTISPLLGLLGTVQGMILAFMQTASGAAGVNKAEQLAEGIYVALVTTFAGLTVAIPAAVLSHYLEGRIQKLFERIDDLVQAILPQLERFEGRVRVSRVASTESQPDPGLDVHATKEEASARGTPGGS